jgi:hypothetical protein
MDMQALAADLRWSVKWTSISILPIAALVAVLVMLLGGIEGDAKAVFVVAMAPMLVLGPVTKGLDGWVAWSVFVVAEYAYVLLIFVIGRVLWRKLRMHSG